MMACPGSVRLWSAGLALVGAGSAWAQASPHALGLFQTVSYQPNVFQAANGGDRSSDVISSTGANFGLKHKVDSVDLFANGNVQANVYQDTKSLNNTSYGLSVGAGTTVERLAGTVRFAASQALGNYGTPGAAATTEKNLQNNEEAALAMRYRLTPRTNLVGGLGYQSLAYSAAAFESQENSSGVAFIDVTHQLDPELALGAGLRAASGRTPKYASGTIPGTFIADEFDSQYVDLLASWRLGRSNTVNARFSLTRVNHTQATQLDFTGLTGVVSWNMVMGSRLVMSASLMQNTGSGPALFGPVVFGSSGAPAGDATGSHTDSGSTPGGQSSPPAGGSALGSGGTPPSGVGASGVSSTPASNNRLNTTVNFATTYQLSRTVAVNGNLSLNNAGLVNASSVSGNAWSTVLGLGVTYLPSRSISLGCALSMTLQNASQSAESSGQAVSYRSPAASCTGTIGFL